VHLITPNYCSCFSSRFTVQNDDRVGGLGWCRANLHSTHTHNVSTLSLPALYTATWVLKGILSREKDHQKTDKATYLVTLKYQELPFTNVAAGPTFFPLRLNLLIVKNVRHTTICAFTWYCSFKIRKKHPTKQLVEFEAKEKLIEQSTTNFLM
jgi:hypothetical protein